MNLTVSAALVMTKEVERVIMVQMRDVSCEKDVE